jgi:multiple sugar transport system substrate-binding protein
MAGCGGRRGDRAAVEGSIRQPVLTILCMSGASAVALQELVKDYPTSACVRVAIAQFPRADFHDQVALQFEQGTTDFELVLGQCHWLSGKVQNRSYVDLSSLLKREIGVLNVHPKVRQVLCESPKGSGTYYAAPCYPDPMGLVYRKDWLDDPGEKDAFKKRYSRDLKPPATWAELVEIAEFFQRPEKGRYGVILLTGRDFDGLAYSFQQVFFAMGGRYCEGDTCRLAGFLNSDVALESLTLLKRLVKAGSPEGAESDENDVNSVFVQGNTAMAINYFSSFPGLVTTMGDKLGFVPVPAGRDGKRICMTEGLGLSLSSKISVERQDRATAFLKWFMSPETMRIWNSKVHFAYDLNTLSNSTWVASQPYLAAYRDSLDSIEGFWDVPVHVELMRSFQKHVGDAIDDYVEPQKALDDLVTECETVLREAYLLKEW